MVHDIHVINPRVNGVKVQKYLENFRKESLRLSHRHFISSSLKILQWGKSPILSEKEVVPLSAQTNLNPENGKPRTCGV